VKLEGILLDSAMPQPEQKAPVEQADRKAKFANVFAQVMRQGQQTTTEQKQTTAETAVKQNKPFAEKVWPQSSCDNTLEMEEQHEIPLATIEGLNSLLAAVKELCGEHQDLAPALQQLASLLQQLQTVLQGDDAVQLAQNGDFTVQKLCRELAATLAQLQQAVPLQQLAKPDLAKLMQQLQAIQQQLVLINDTQLSGEQPVGITDETPVANAVQASQQHKPTGPEQQVGDISTKLSAAARANAHESVQKAQSTASEARQTTQADAAEPVPQTGTSKGGGCGQLVTVETTNGELKQAVACTATETGLREPAAQAVSTKDVPVQRPNQAAVMQQIVQRAQLIRLPEHSEMRIQLKPAHLGELTLKIIAENGLITAKFYAESYQVKEIIESSLPQLKQSLAQQGLKTDQIDVFLGGRGFGDTAQQFQQQRQWRLLGQNASNARHDYAQLEEQMTVLRPNSYQNYNAVDYIA